MNRMKITFGIMSNKYQIEAYNKLDAYAAISLYLGAYALPFTILYEPSDILEDNWVGDIEKFLSLFERECKYSVYIYKYQDEIKEAYSTIKEI